MNLYEYAKTYLEAQTRRYFPTYNVANLNRYNRANLYNYQPMFSTVQGSETVTDIYRMLAFILQNRFNLPNVINFASRYGTIEELTHGYDVAYMATKNYQELTREFYRIWHFKAYRSWLRYCKGLVDAANYLRGHFTTFPEYLAELRGNPVEGIRALCEISGIGETMARNFVKEIGLYEFGKPDIHLITIFQSFDPTVISSDITTFDRALREQSVRAGCTPYELDKILWLICSGKYYLDGLKISSGKRELRENFIRALRTAIDAGVVII